MKKKYKLMNVAGGALAVTAFMYTTVSNAALFFWDNGNGDALYSTAANWNPDGNPGSADLAVANVSALAPIIINGNWSVDSLRMSDGGSVTHSNGTLTITDGVGPDDGLWVGEGGNAVCTYNFSGGTILLNDNQNSFDIGRGNGSVAYFNMSGGTVTNIGTGDAFFVGRFGGSYGRVNLTGGILNGPPSADTHIGLDGVGEWYQSGGTYNSGAVQIGRFASPACTVELSSSAVWNVGLVLLADGHGVFNPRNSSAVNLTLIGSNVVYNSTGLVAMKEANLTFDGTGGGVSTMHMGGGIMLLDDAEIFPINLPVPSNTNQVIVLIDQIGSYPGPDSQFINAPAGSIYDAGSLDWQIQYSSTNVILVSVTDCVSATIGIQPASQQIIFNNGVTFSGGAGGSSPTYQWQFNNADIGGATSSSYNIPNVDYTNAGNYRVIVTTPCNGQSVTSAVAVLEVVNPHTFYVWDNGGGDNLVSNTNNWSPDGLPYVQDFAGDFISAPLVINNDLSVDTFRLGNDASVLHTNGTLRIVNGVFGDNGLWMEFGAPNSYTLNGGTILIQDPVDGFMVGRAGGSVSTFNFLSGTISNVVGDTHIGLDGVATWNQSSGFFRGAGVQIGRFANNAPVHANLSGNAIWNVGLVLLADGHGVFSPRNTNDVLLTLVGPNVSYDSSGMVMFDEGKIVFDGTGGGFSTMNFGNGIFLLTNGRLYVTNAPKPSVIGQEIVLIENIGSYPGADQQFDNAPDGTVYNVDCGGGQWTLDYRPNVNPTNVVLVATAVPAAVTITSISVSGGNATINFSAGASDNAACFELWGSASVNGTYANQSAVISSLGAGNFQTTVPVIGGSTGFYRIRRL